MKLKNLLIGVVSGLVLTACGAPLPEEEMPAAEEIGTSQGALCEGWDSGARRCTWKCSSNSTYWYSVAAGAVAYGQCQDYANAQCGKTAYGACWSF